MPCFGPWKCIIITHWLFPSFVWFNTNRLHKIITVVKTKVKLFGLIFGLSLNMIYESGSIKWWFKLIVSLLQASEIIFSLIESRDSCRLSHVMVPCVFFQVQYRKLWGIGWQFSQYRMVIHPWLLRIINIHLLKISWFKSSINLSVRRIWHEIRHWTTLITSCHASWVWKLFYYSTKTNTSSINLVLTEFYSTIKIFVSLCRHFWRELITQMTLKKSLTSCFNVN